MLSFVVTAYNDGGCWRSHLDRCEGIICPHI
jgi:hypothetical protein